MKLADIATKNIGENDLNPRMKYIMATCTKGWQYTGYFVEQELYMTILYWVEDLNQPIWNICIKFDTWNNIENCTFMEEKSVKRKPYK